MARWRAWWSWVHGVRKGRLGSGEYSVRTLTHRAERTERAGLTPHTTSKSFSAAEKTWIPGSLEACYAP